MGGAKPFIERILRLKEEQDNLSADIREVYAEAKAEDIDKTALGQAVATIRKRQKKGEAECQELDALVSAYLESYYGGAVARTRVREATTDSSLPGSHPVEPVENGAGGGERASGPALNTEVCAAPLGAVPGGVCASGEPRGLAGNGQFEAAPEGQGRTVATSSAPAAPALTGDVGHTGGAPATAIADKGAPTHQNAARVVSLRHERPGGGGAASKQRPPASRGGAAAPDQFVLDPENLCIRRRPVTEAAE